MVKCAGLSAQVSARDFLFAQSLEQLLQLDHALGRHATARRPLLRPRHRHLRHVAAIGVGNNVDRVGNGAAVTMHIGVRLGRQLHVPFFNVAGHGKGAPSALDGSRHRGWRQEVGGGKVPNGIHPLLVACGGRDGDRVWVSCPVRVGEHGGVGGCVHVVDRAGFEFAHGSGRSTITAGIGQVKLWRGGKRVGWGERGGVAHGVCLRGSGVAVEWSLLGRVASGWRHIAPRSDQGVDLSRFVRGGIVAS